MIIQRADDGAEVWKVEVADSWLARLRGLIGRSSLPAGEGLYFPGTNGIHMLFMRFAIDCVFVTAVAPDGAQEVVAVARNMRPWTGVVWFVRRAKGAIELGAGGAAQAGINVGDRVRLVSA
jgi:uncharacterized membrane protein (UPF0127 family)